MKPSIIGQLMNLNVKKKERKKNVDKTKQMCNGAFLA